VSGMNEQVNEKPVSFNKLLLVGPFLVNPGVDMTYDPSKKFFGCIDLGSEIAYTCVMEFPNFYNHGTDPYGEVVYCSHTPLFIPPTVGVWSNYNIPWENIITPEEVDMADQIDSQLDFAIKNGMNVMLSGKHGVGKTARINAAMERHDINFIYFSGSTMDPFVDFIGVPKEMTNEQGETYLGFVRPEALMDDSLEAIFIDEYNRSDKGVRNAVMELIQFKSINGRKFPNLKYVWTAINPDDDDDFNYDTEQLDPAQSDRFQMQIEVPYKVSASYFSKKYPGGNGASAVQWWNTLTDKQKNSVSPRRLDYAMDAFVNFSATKALLKTIFPKGINVSDFMNVMSAGSLKKRITEAHKSNDTELMETLVNGSDTKAVVDNLESICDQDVNLFHSVVESATDETLVRIVRDYAPITRDVMKTCSDYDERLRGLLSLESLDDTVRTQIEVLLDSDEGIIMPTDTPDEFWSAFASNEDRTDGDET
jgi:hypothetical protein